MNGTNFKKLAQQKLHTWMTENHLEGDYVVHHRDDTEECRQYNSKDAYYNMWGFNLDGTFEYGKYVVFITRSEHSVYHNKGKQHTESTKQKISEANKGKLHSEEAKQKMSESHKSIVFSEEHRQKLSESQKGLKAGNKHPMYGKHHTEEAKQKMSESKKGKVCSEEHKQKLSEAHKQQMSMVKTLYTNYKNNGGTLSWNAFRSAIKTGELYLEEQING